jgi:hypothetical protein
VEKLIAKLKVYGDSTSVSELESQHARIKDMLDAIGCETSGGDKESESFAFRASLSKYRLTMPTELPPRVKEALLRLATDDRIKELEAMLREQVKIVRADNEDSDCDLKQDFSIPTAVDWEEGTEDLQSMSMDELWAMIGLSDIKAIPGFNTKVDPDGAHNNPTPHVSCSTSVRFHYPPPLSSASHSIFGFGGENPTSAQSQVPHLLLPQLLDQCHPIHILHTLHTSFPCHGQ